MASLMFTRRAPPSRNDQRRDAALGLRVRRDNQVDFPLDYNWPKRIFETRRCSLPSSTKGKSKPGLDNQGSRSATARPRSPQPGKTTNTHLSYRPHYQQRHEQDGDVRATRQTVSGPATTVGQPVRGAGRQEQGERDRDHEPLPQPRLCVPWQVGTTVSYVVRCCLCDAEGVRQGPVLWRGCRFRPL